MNIYQIEITNKCNLSCYYCPRSAMTRPIKTIDKDVIDHICNIITSKKVRLHHFGESLLELDILLYTIKVLNNKKIKVELNTNGILLTNSNFSSLIKMGLSKLYISFHNYNSIKNLSEIKNDKDKINILFFDEEKYKDIILDLLNNGFKCFTKRLRDLGQLNNTEKRSDFKNCSFLVNNEVVVLSNGKIVRCCECFDDSSDCVLGNIWETNIENRIIKKCETCLGYSNDHGESEKKNVR